MPSNPASRKLHRISRYLIARQMALVAECRHAQNWTTFDDNFVALVYALTLIARLRAASLGREPGAS